MTTSLLLRVNNMSMYDNNDIDNIYDKIKWFLEEYLISELLFIVADVVD